MYTPSPSLQRTQSPGSSACLQLFSSWTPPTTDSLSKSSLSLKHLPSPFSSTSSSSQLKHHLPQIRVRLPTDEKGIFCTALRESLLTKHRLSSLETRKYLSVANCNIKKLFVVYSSMFSDFVDTLYF